MRREFQYTRLNVAGGTARLAEKRCVKILYDAPLPRESAEQVPAAPLVTDVTPAATLEPLSRRGRPKKHH